MDFIKQIMPVLWQIVEKNKRCAVNVSEINNKLTVNILSGHHRKVFDYDDGAIILGQLKQYLIEL